MSAVRQQRSVVEAPGVIVCALDDILPGSGVCALVGRRQVAIFRVGDDLYALDNFDPLSGANVLARGLVGDLGGERVVASPIFKHHYALASGRCVERPDVRLRTWTVALRDGDVCVEPEPREPC